MTEREYEHWLEHRLAVLRDMQRLMEKDLNEIRRRRMSAYLDRLETSCNPSMEMVRYD